MPPITISRRIFVCLLLILLSHYGETASKTRYLESILTTLERIEKVLKRNNEFGYVVPLCKLLNSVLDVPEVSPKEDQANAQQSQLQQTQTLTSSDADATAFRKSLLSGHDVDNLNANININGHPNRRNFDNSMMSSNKIANQNVNMYGQSADERHYAKINKFDDDY